MTVTKKVKLTEQGLPKIKRSKIKVNLRCTHIRSKVARKVKIFNDTDQAVPKGRTIHWETDDGDKGSKELQSPLAPGESFLVIIPQTEPLSFTCKAWYFGPPLEIVAKGKIKVVE